MILILDNYDSFTWNLVQRIGELDPTLALDRDILVVRNDRITPEDAERLRDGRGPSHLIVSPGPCTPAESGVSRDLIRHFAGRIPVMGVCLGHQCIGDLHGMPVARHPIPVHGKTSPVHHDGLGVFSGLPNPFIAARYHSLVVPPEAVPAPPSPGEGGWIVSAWTDEPQEGGGTRRVVMGLRRVWAEADPLHEPLEGVQFHPESFLTEAGPALLANFLAMGPSPRAVRPHGDAAAAG